MISISNIDVFFEPKSIALIGASESFKFGYWTTEYLLQSDFKTYPVNPNKDFIFGHKTYRNVKDIPNQIDLAIIIVNNDRVLESVKNCVEKGVKGIIIESAGFAETGIKKYIEIQNEIERIAKTTGIRIIGPNCVGVTNFYNKFTSAEVDFSETLEGGKISIIAQSGVLGNIFIDWGSNQKISFSKSITLGNKVDVDEADMLEYLEEDPNTNVITIYLEGVKRGQELLKAFKKVSKPILILKNGRSDMGSRAIISHTGSIAGNDKIYNAIFKKFPNIFRVNDFFEMFNIAQVFANQPLPKGKNIAILTTSGSLGILACDLIDQLGLKLAILDKHTVKALKSISPTWTSINNPIDLGPSLFSTFRPALNALFEDKNVDAILYIFAVPKKPIQTFSISIMPHMKDMKNLSNKYQKPIITCVFGSRWVVDYFLKYADKYNIPIITQVNHAIKALKFMYDFKKSNY
ncbi:MAG: acetate--CoA ligase family protein [Promethearchaeota archaeon]